MTLLIACGLKREARIFARAGGDVIAVVGGGDAARLERGLESALTRPDLAHPDAIYPHTTHPNTAHPGEGRGPVSDRSQLGPGLRRGGDSGFIPAQPWILSCGIAGALSPDLRTGDVVIDGDATVVALLCSVLPDAIAGRVAGGDAIIATADAKRALATKTGAIAADMESHVVARVARARDLAFGVLRVISDTAADDLPPAALVGMRPDGEMALGAVLASLARTPGQLPALLRTGRQAGTAFAALGQAFEAIIAADVDRLDIARLPDA